MEEKNRQQEIRDKGFDMTSSGPTTYGTVKVGLKKLENATLALGSLAQTNRDYGNKNNILKALADQDVSKLRAISNYFYRTSGIYQRACNYFATMYRYDWYVVAESWDKNATEDKVVEELFRMLHYLDNSYIKKICGDIALEVIKSGAYYGYIVENPMGLVLQQLPASYCRVRYHIGNIPAVEFNMRYFDDQFPDVAYRMKVLKIFPDEFAKGYTLYRQGKLKQDNITTLGSYQNEGWYLLEPGNVVKFNFNDSDIPMFVNMCPAILDLDGAQALDRRKQMQKLLKIIVQKLPMDKNGELIFDVEEAQDIHNNAVQMLRNAIGVDVLTTFTDVDAIDMADKNTSTTVDDLEKMERAVYNAMGSSKNLFNTDGNLSLEKSILNDEGSIRSLHLQFQIFFDTIVQKRSKKKAKFRFHMLETTQYNYKEIAKLYKEQTQLGFQKLLPQIALGHSQSAILSGIYFENEILHLPEIMIPPLSSSTMKAEDVLGGKEAGRPEKADDEKSDKTLANKESMS